MRSKLGSCRRFGVRPIFRAIQGAVRRLVLLQSPSAYVNGLRVYVCLAEKGEVEEQFSGVDQIIQVIDRVDQRAAARLRRNVKAIVVLESGPQYWIGQRACVLPDVRPYSALQMAGILIHEVTHAWLHSRGIPYDRVNADRVERVCISAEIRFLQRAGAPIPLIEAVEKQLSEGHWSLEGRQRRAEEDAVKLGAPDWSLRWYRRWLERGISDPREQQ